MSPFVDYWLKANLFLLFFYGCYWLLLRRHTFLALNRAYLLGSVGLALLLPLLHIPGLTFPWPWENSDPVAATVSLDTLTLVGTVTDGATPSPGLDWPVLGGWLFGLGAAVLLLRTGWRTLSLLTLIRQWTRHTLTDHVLVLPDTNRVPTFSFFCYLVLNPDDTQTEAIRQHELVHIRQAHTLDVLLLELVQAFCWPNPALIGYRRAIRQVHEYLADRDAAPQTATHRDAYARFLVSYAFHLPQPGPATDSLAHSFGPPRPDSPTLKQRIQMLYQQHTRPRALWKYALVLPLATLLLAMTNEPEPATAGQSGQRSSWIVGSVADSLVHVNGSVRDNSQKPLPGATIAVKGGRKGTTTDARGNYELDVPTNSRLVVSFVGHEPQEMLVVGRAGDTNLFRTTLATAGSEGSTTRTATRPSPPTSQTAPAGKSYSVVDGEVFSVVEVNPTFPGGTGAMLMFLNKNVHYPTRAIRANVSGIILVETVIGTNGALTNIRVLKGVGFGLDQEAMRVVELMPKWIPGRQNSRPVAVKYVIPIKFDLDDKAGIAAKPANPILDEHHTIQPGQPEQAYPSSLKLDGESAGTINIRINDKLNTSFSDPLIYIDGVEATKGEMDKLNTDLIQTVEVLKSTYAVDKYGEKGRNGVILIKTKKDKDKK